MQANSILKEQSQKLRIVEGFQVKIQMFDYLPKVHGNPD